MERGKGNKVKRNFLHKPGAPFMFGMMGRRRHEKMHDKMDGEGNKKNMKDKPSVDPRDNAPASPPGKPVENKKEE